MVAVDPVEDVECPVGAECKQVVAGDRLCLAGLRNHEQLGQDGDRLKIDGECPEDFHHGELVVEDHGQDSHGGEKELNPEAVMVAVISGAEFDIHQVHCCRRRDNEEHLHDGIKISFCMQQGVEKEGSYVISAGSTNLHDGVVETDKVGDEVEVSGDEDHQEEDLGFPRYPRAAPCFPYLSIQFINLTISELWSLIIWTPATLNVTFHSFGKTKHSYSFTVRVEKTKN